MKLVSILLFLQSNPRRAGLIVLNYAKICLKGDAIHTGANRAREDEKDLKKVTIDLELFDAFSSGYLEQAGKILNRQEISHLAFSAKYMTFIIGLRFLTDYIDGDHYFRISFTNHNLQRARSQFKLLETMEEKFDQMKEIIAKIAKG